MKFSQHTVGHGSYLTVNDGVYVRLTPDQYRRRKHTLADVKKDDLCYIAKVVGTIMFKIGETFEIEGPLPKSYWSMVTDPPKAVEKAPAENAGTGAVARAMKKAGDKAKATVKAPAKAKGKGKGKRRALK